ncbi:uncharacterized protein LOC135144056 [Zophobas morio]|uniref:uncharacterized protein LOC135144056 n=1 Tax=Zophobas morio TaxID=2755281 RepID=UPI003082E6ED
MISRRDNLLVRPWQQRRYDNHRKKVQTAAPAIDNRTPLPRQHVTLKLKKKQKESERCEEIEKNNFSLLKRLSYVMRTSRVDNAWSTPQPNFLNRVSIYDTKLPKFEDLYIDEPLRTPDGRPTRKSKCLACTPQRIPEVKIPEERIPWEPEKPTISRFRSKSVPPPKPVVVAERKVPRSALAIAEPPKKKKVEPKFSAKEPQSIILSRGCLKLSVNFPSDTLVKLNEGHQEKVLIDNVCHCKSVTAVAI